MGSSHFVKLIGGIGDYSEGSTHTAHLECSSAPGVMFYTAARPGSQPASQIPRVAGQVFTGTPRKSLKRELHVNGAPMSTPMSLSFVGRNT